MRSHSPPPTPSSRRSADTPRVSEADLRRLLQDCPLEEWGENKLVGDLGEAAFTMRLETTSLSLTLSLPPSLVPFAASIEARLRARLEPQISGRKLALVLTSEHSESGRRAAGGAAPPSPASAHKSAEGKEGRQRGMAGVKIVLGVASGKGGVGKSTLAVNLALALAQQGGANNDGDKLRVGLLDADLYGPSLVPMLALDHAPQRNEEGLLIPERRFGIDVLSMGSMLDPKQALVWRGPLIAKALKQLLEGSAWGELDLLLLDMPPGTGDLPLSLAQSAHLDAVMLVATPQHVALYDVRKSLAMFVKLRIPVLGIVENMSGFRCLQCGHESPVFGQGGALELSREHNLPLLGRLPLSQELQESADKAVPLMGLLDTPKDADTSPSAQEEARSLHRAEIREGLRSIARALARALARQNFERRGLTNKG